MSSLNPREDGGLASLEAVADGAIVELEALVDGEPESVLVHRSGQTVRAWLNICPHAGRRLDWAPGQFLVSKAGHLVCAAHGASFSLADGLCVDGPCKGESLRAVPVTVRDGRIVAV
ncbi:Rieske (2Fe-2S) protein [Luteimonas deserti]|uniref:Rieske 2Fe-2S domain-containing protein n=1 Tax=Luteimonas deserti TaxID=2752306 RepID=A0A7Z0QRD8_9GAMM|nr:Rieske 2Fe-2S domain-containing protein [Luteimonas deserti]NYZ62447.1 Rieske 2Fe-2S domain-containing protein [Luteimonas deserti]